MDAVKENKFSALVKTQAFLGDNAAALTDVAQIATQKLVLDSFIQGIVVNDGIATSDTTGFTTAKENARVALVSAALRLTRAAKALALDNDDPIMLQKANYTKTELNTKRDGNLHVAGAQISEFVTPLVPSLAGYRILPAHLLVLDTCIATYFSTIPKPGSEIDQKVVANRNVEELIAKAFNLLNSKMDAYLDLFLDDFPDLVEAYYLARAIDDMTGGGGGSGGSGGGSAQIFNGTVNAMSSVSAGPIIYNGAASIKLSTLSPVSLSFQLMDGAMATGGPVNVGPSTNVTVPLSSMGLSGTSISIMNSGMMPCDYNINIQ
jgi:hypothetical protein